MAAAQKREFDVVVFGATGWTGVHCAEYLALNYSPHSHVKWALAGRSLPKLEAVRDRVARLVQGQAWVHDIELIVADASNEAQLAAAVKRTKAVASVVGPFAQFGEPLVKVCIENGTHYVDITGETQWVREMVAKYDGPARDAGVHVIPSCGFDSVPSDLGTFLAVDAMRKRYNLACKEVRGYMSGFQQNNLVKVGNGPKPGGGTLISLLNAFDDAPREIFNNPNALVLGAPATHKPPQLFISYDSKLPSKRWTTHFVMSWVNEKTVMRSKALLKDQYGTAFSYREAMTCSNPLLAFLIALGCSLLYAVLALPFGSSFLRRFVPEQSQTPPERTSAYEPGYIEFTFVAEADGAPKSLVTKVFGSDEGGYAETSKMLLESALCLALELDSVRLGSGLKGGILTPATMGHTLIKRLTAKHMKFSVLDSGSERLA